MKKTIKRIILFVMTLCICISVAGCMTEEEVLNDSIIELEKRVEELKTERDLLENEIANIKIENGTAKYVITFNIKQTHYTMDVGQHIKDEMNALSIQIPVDKEYYDSVEIGDTIADDFRMGSLVLYGSFGSWDITVEDKNVK